MSLNPSSGQLRNHNPKLYGYVATLFQLPTACERSEGAVVFCDEDKRFYECIHVQSDTEDYYRWIAVTSGGQRSFFIPVEGLNDKEMPTTSQPTPPKRSNSFDAIASALNEIAVGLLRYNVGVEPLCFKQCFDKTYVDGQHYYVWNNNYDRADYVVTKDEDPISGKPYFLKHDVYNYETIVFGRDAHFDRSKTYFESTRPIFIPEEGWTPGDPIDHHVYIPNEQEYNELSLPDLVKKANEIIDAVNMTNSRLKKVDDGCTLFELATLVNSLIDEVNPFSTQLNMLFERVASLETVLKIGTENNPIELPVYIKKNGFTYKVDLNVEGTPKFDITQV